MKVWILQRHHHAEDSTILEVFADSAEAEVALAIIKGSDPHHFFGYTIEEHEVHASPERQ